MSPIPSDLPPGVSGTELREQLGLYLADMPDATPAQIREAVSEFLDRDPRESVCTDLTGHLPRQDHRWQECPTYHDDDA